MKGKWKMASIFLIWMTGWMMVTPSEINRKLRTVLGERREFQACGAIGRTPRRRPTRQLHTQGWGPDARIYGFPGGSEGKASACNVGDLGSIPGSGRSPGEGNGNLLQYSCLENSMDWGAWEATVHGVVKSWTQLNDFTSLQLLNGNWSGQNRWRICRVRTRAEHGTLRNTNI